MTLDQPVGLKFLPEGVAATDTRIGQFHNELRVARQVSHKNVCRLYDLGEADGRRFLTMEYVDGEDLASSLRRFGRMPPDKAVQIARQLCAGIAAAHEKGVHRDLKPANVMLDGNGDLRITDFGIATLGEDAGSDVAGTPQYRAPELLAGKAATTKSDIYALGLILFEIFTGKRAYQAKTLGELKQLHDTTGATVSRHRRPPRRISFGAARDRPGEFGGGPFGAITGGIVWIYYLAIEPYARRFWPDALLGWTRMLSGHVRDPRVGRELLIGLVCGAVGLLIDLSKLIPMALAWRIPVLPQGGALPYLDGVPSLLAQWLNVVIGALSSALAIALIFLVLRLVLKRPRLALVVGFFVLLVLLNGGSVISGNWFDRFNNLGFTLLLTVVLHRFGLLATATALFVDNIVTDVPLTMNLAAWWSTPMIASLLMLIAVAWLAFSAARAGQPCWDSCSRTEPQPADVCGLKSALHAGLPQSVVGITQPVVGNEPNCDQMARC